MKINKVEISAFRAYDKVENGTFDFNLPNNQVADFISIYAPNGYGKTSFYDAVEWCITGQIERFHRNYQEYKKLGIENRKSNKISPYFLQHNDQKEHLGEVNVHTSHADYHRKLTTSKVYDFKKKATNLYFKDVLLSQELIDAFIKEDKAEDRYIKFVENISSLGHYNNAFKNIIKLTENTSDIISKLNKTKTEKEDVQLSLEFDSDDKVIEEINESITNLNDKKEGLSLIQSDKFSKNELDALTQKVNSRITALEIEIEELNLQIQKVDESFNGVANDPSRIGVTEYSKQIKNKEKLLAQRKVANTVLDEIQELNIKEIQLKSSLKELDELIELNDTLQKNKIKFLIFKDIKSDLERKTTEIEKTETELKEIVNSETNLASQIDSFNIDLEKLQEDVKQKNGKLEELPVKKEKLEILQSSKEKKAQLIKNERKNLTSKEEKLKSLNSKLDDFKYFKDILEKDLQVLLEYSYFNKKQNQIEYFLELQNEITSIDKELLDLDNKINDSEKLNTELSVFISKGLSIITEKKSSTCVLCSKQYNSFEELADRINNNKLLEDSLQLLFKEKTLLNQKKEKKEKEANGITEELKKMIQEGIDNFQKMMNDISLEKERINRALNKLEQENSSLQNEEQVLLSFFENSSPVDLQKSIKQEIIKLKEKLTENTKKLNQFKKDYEEIKSSKEKLEAKISNLKKKIEEGKNRTEYVEIISYFKNTFKSSTPEMVLLDNEFDKNLKSITKLKKEILEFENSIQSIKKSLSKNDKTVEELKIVLSKIETQQLKYEKLIQNYEQLILTEYKIRLENLPLSEIKHKFEKLKNDINIELEERKNIYKNYLIVQNLKDDTYQFLKSEFTKIEIQNLEEKINVFKNIKAKLEEEKNNLESFLKRTINNFFYSDLISALYQKIDPHPDYNKIEFDCDFTESKPRLQIYTVDKTGNRSIPTLYFSTAQINVLSLSIFLARALKAKNSAANQIIECIFIDDPIQSMDSINILSFIGKHSSKYISINPLIFCKPLEIAMRSH